MSVRVRFAPSPTGYLHIGGLRTALYNYLFARHNNGKFILRIEDTDRSRYVEGAIENLINSLKWVGIDFDEGPGKDGMFGPYIQSERLDIYKHYANILLESGWAYRAFDTPEEIEEMRKRLSEAKLDSKYDRMNMKNELTMSQRDVNELINKGTPYVIRLKIPEGEIKFYDIIRGEVIVSCKEIDDQVLLKSDAYPTYHLANVVDDHLMKITHVIRGEEWLPSTPKHIILYDAFKWEKPEFAHLPLLLNKDKSKLSKRQGDVALEDYIQKGYFKEAIINFVALLGWNPSGDREIYSLQELIDSFDLRKVNKSGAVFDIQKLDWMNGYYLRHSDDKILVEKLKDVLERISLSYPNEDYLYKVIHLFKDRVSFIHQIPEIADYMFNKPAEYEKEYLEKHWDRSKLPLILNLLEKLKISDFTHDNLQNNVKAFCEEKNIKLKEIIHPLRLMITGKSSGAGMFETMEVLGKEECIERIVKFINSIE